MRQRLSGLWMVINRPPCDEEPRLGEGFGELSRAAPPEPKSTRQPRLGRSGSPYPEHPELLQLLTS